MMRISPQLKMNLGKIALITVCFVLINIFIAFFSDTMLRSIYSLGPSSLYDTRTSLLISIIIGLISGVLGGGTLVTVSSRLFRKKSFRFAITTTAIAYVIVFFLAAFINAFIANRILIGDKKPFSEVLVKSFEFMMNSTLFSFFILWGFITLSTLFLLQVNDKFGPGILAKFLMGKYHHPREEKRIFMFADMRSSTTIAEKIGHVQYFNLLSDMFADITETIVNNEGEIYQYVGDEIVISWPLKKGIDRANCLRCFMQIREKLLELAPFYNKKYGIKPELKAGLHFGQVMAGEIGIIKKDIIYSGDVLNTTARIQEQCNQYKVDVLISKETFDLIKDQDQNLYELVPLGTIELRGKEQKIDLNTVRMI